MVQHLEHRAAGLDHPVRRQPFPQQVLAGDVAICQVDVCNMIDDLAVGLLRHPLIEASVSRLHVKDRDLSSLGRNCRQAAVGIAEDQERLRLRLRQHRIELDDSVADGLRGVGACGVQEMVRLADLQVGEEDLVQFIIEVLAGVDQDVIGVLVESRHHPGQAYDLGAGTDDRHHFHSFHRNLPFTPVGSLDRSLCPASRGRRSGWPRTGRSSPLHRCSRSNECTRGECPPP